MAVRGRKVHIDLEELEKLCMMHATDEELAGFFGVTTRTIERRRQKPEIALVMERGKAKGKLTVRRQQFRILEQGNATMGIWLGKQLLGQSDYRPGLGGPQVVISLGDLTLPPLQGRRPRLIGPWVPQLGEAEMEE
jgi:hypothetical protein